MAGIDVPNVALEGVGDGPLRPGKTLEAAARELKHEGRIGICNSRDSPNGSETPLANRPLLLKDRSDLPMPVN